MTLLTDNAAIAAFCDRMAAETFVAVDTEFLRDRTYWPQLCLVQIAGAQEAVAIDPLAPGVDMQPVFALMRNPAVLKVFHAARQDLEIFLQLDGVIPTPIVDTQVAAMVCGFGDSVSYETLATRLANAKIDKSSRFTDWSNRPLSERQLTYALSDVTYLRTVYEKLRARLAKTGREHWIAEEMRVLSDPAEYTATPEECWRRLKPRTGGAKFLSILKELAAWREVEAQRRNLPRARLLKDEALMEIAALAPRSVDDLARSRSVSRGQAEGPIGEAVLEMVRRGIETPPQDAPKLPQRSDPPPGRAPLLELMKVLLKAKCEQYDVAQKLVATTADLEMIAADDDADTPALHGWRRELFGEDALALKQGRLALAAGGDSVRVIQLPA